MANKRERERPQVLAELQTTVSADVEESDFVSAEESHELHEKAVERLKGFRVWHRVWGECLRGEVAATLRAIAQRLPDEEALMMTRAGFVRVPSRNALEYLAREVESKPPASNYLRQEDLVLISREADDGLALGYWHPDNGYEYELDAWGRYAFDLAKP
jgi:hypothetical protein